MLGKLFFIPLTEINFFSVVGMIWGILLAATSIAKTKEPITSSTSHQFAESLPPQNILFQKHYNVLLVDKLKRELKMYAPSPSGQPHFVRALPADIGKNPGDKMRENDHRTPEGIYFFQKRLSPPEIPFELYGRLALTLDYPNAFDRLMNKTGYGIWLHAVPDSVPLTRGSRGCIVISNQVIDEVAAQIHLGKSAMVIDSAVIHLSKEEWQKAKEESLHWLETWRQTWESQRLADYFSYYHDSFIGNKQMDKSAWIRHKTKISKRYQNIQIRIEPRLILLFRHQWVIRLYQQYRSDQYADAGEKVLYVLAGSNGVRQIIKEDWVQENAEISASQTLTNSVALDSLSE